MSSFLYSLVLLALSLGLAELLRPGKEKTTPGNPVKILCSLLLLCALASPLTSLLSRLVQWKEQGVQSLLPDVTTSQPPAQALEQALEQTSKAYFTQLLTQTLENEFSIPTGQVRCTVEWTETDGSLRPSRVTVILSGSAVWKDPHAMEDFVSMLLNCECQSAIE
ncbi:MAG: hypothetical protein IJX28_04930 [Clostridia bacterium]|nr:hypothetical protein [Clostridia bacterium]